jgi:uncharacterized membrane protein
VVAILGPAIVRWVPLDALRVVVGGILLVFGLQWLRKAVLRATGYKAKHDEDAIFAKQVKAIAVEGPRPAGGVGTPGSAGSPGTAGSRGRAGSPGSPGRDSVGFSVAFKGVFLEGLEVVIIVLTLGATDHNLGLAAVSAVGAALIVAGVGVVVARQLAGVPENAMKMGVGLMLVSFGTFWSGEGLGVHWPGHDAAIPVLLGVYAIVTYVMVRTLRTQRGRQLEEVGRGV